MITVSIGSHRFESGPTYHFNNSNFDELNRIVLDPAETVEYVNAVPNVNSTPAEVREVAVSGIARLALQFSDSTVLQRASSTLVSVCDGGTVDKADFTDRYYYGEDVFHGAGLSNQILDSASVLATRRNKVEETAGIITQQAPTDEGYFIIGLANGGLISAARTYLHLGEGNNSFGVVRYSRRKNDDKKPDMYPHSDSRKAWFKREAEGRQVIVVDEDYGTGQTLKTATDYFAVLLKTKVLGIAPVEVERRITFNPLVIKSE